MMTKLRHNAQQINKDKLFNPPQVGSQLDGGIRNVGLNLAQATRSQFGQAGQPSGGQPAKDDRTTSTSSSSVSTPDEVRYIISCACFDWTGNSATHRQKHVQSKQAHDIKRCLSGFYLNGHFSSRSNKKFEELTQFGPVTC